MAKEATMSKKVEKFGYMTRDLYDRPVHIFIPMNEELPLEVIERVETSMIPAGLRTVMGYEVFGMEVK
jgi:hypothetical protein